ncbi:4-alpha-glucanotransferase (amylomaltase) [Paramagnetospirillum magnetotacticum MS-1]|uniref:4-alpha-glucanotransferase n=1 Tax=Paramagnetospirillum magnetotacticum MS-1 TaxID=272627 RepID=A0A0C2YYF2_PARME|nr:4-alpha-glucanotransferase [Paramagnetospirillum magnetotacticum]KIM00099.1 4-alpha-glucanotransferase (amylomaltase) [Paramagnetospirillum magnetotacticum MS-1]
MSGTDALDRLARLAGIEDGWWDFFGEWRVVPPETKRVFLGAMGLPADSDEQVWASLKDLESRSWRRALEPVMLAEEHGTPPSIAITLPAEADEAVHSWVLEEELGIRHQGSFRPGELRWSEEYQLDGHLIHRHWLDLPALPPCGYHRLILSGPKGVLGEMAMIVTPPSAFVPEQVESGAGAWGIATQIYSLRSERDWGVGTYGNLGDLAEGAAKLGAACVGINPLHALFPADPERFSPYSPSSRRFLNIAYIDVEAIPEFQDCLEARRMFASPGYQATLARLRGYALIEYPDVMRLSRPMLEVLYRWFRRTSMGDDNPRGQAFRTFQAEQGVSGQRFAVFEALHDQFTRDGTPYWRHWPEQYRRPDSAALADFVLEHVETVEFFQWLQFIADEQLAEAQARGKAAGAAIGLYRDLAVGIAGDGAEAWAQQDSLALGVSVGAPPDPLALKGQDWGLVPFNPITLRENFYAPFIEVMAANMRHAGALRLDHAMSLARLYWVPPGQPADQGAYVRYPAEDLFRLVALESRRNRCLVIGEDLGTVPEGFRERMDRMGIFAYRVMVFEKTKDGAFRAPEDFDTQALAIAATHDLPSLRGWWAAKDIDRREKLDLYPREGQAAEERAARAADRAAMVAALAGQGLLAVDFPVGPALSDDQAVALSAAVHATLGRSASKLMMVQMEDVLGQEIQMNLPGTTTQHPNWRLRYKAETAAILADARIVSTAEGLKAGGR